MDHVLVEWEGYAVPQCSEILHIVIDCAVFYNTVGVLWKFLRKNTILTQN